MLNQATETPTQQEFQPVSKSKKTMNFLTLTQSINRPTQKVLVGALTGLGLALALQFSGEATKKFTFPLLGFAALAGTGAIAAWVTDWENAESGSQSSVQGVHRTLKTSENTHQNLVVRGSEHLLSLAPGTTEAHEAWVAVGTVLEESRVTTQPPIQRSQQVHFIDPMTGYYEIGDSGNDQQPVRDSLSGVVCGSPSLPESPLPGADDQHDYEAAQPDAPTKLETDPWQDDFQGTWEGEPTGQSRSEALPNRVANALFSFNDFE